MKRTIILPYREGRFDKAESTSKQIKTFRISEENQKHLERLTKKLDRTEGWIINKALDLYVKQTKP